MANIRLKVVVVGDGGSGKTCLVMRFQQGIFKETFLPTVVGPHLIDFEVDGKVIALDVCDTAHHDEFSRLRAMTYSDTNAVLICFGIDNPASLENVQEKWIPEVMHFCAGVPIIVLGCRNDLRNDPKTIEMLRQTSQHPVSPEEGMAVADKIHAHHYLECSAKTGECVQEVFLTATRTALLSRSKTGRKCIIT
ncbi:hypothetical protein CALCODRAFT_493744 [Calocera cornea HHB12733]|uniref:Uncharacterized protein n=1 Tax=Calocera cornea HHB12733 TaxID=1353952 RepID=A0A165HK10_9BASI|nr:hypothetical protein CALCODRAFT_493744 [Calocera cornea HHB12733]